ncbi:UPF0661 TPR repeat-containing protein C16D10.01c [Paragonimus heterotremus]|uniref:UPF0661 TPR repeat-containing protein C16D10.01c n=1 Tax=Paragonimus heterotremus TaxID=100268 RepID=A0A8J4SXP4_9TREM|nr:UPF0661 TPR repeat-containing protein C16D10.01c [Paragonimus heterotremus]
MGKPAKHSKKKKSFTSVLHNPVSASSAVSSGNLSVEQLIKKAAECENRFETMDALKIYNRALKKLENDRESGSQNDSQSFDRMYVKVLQASAFNLLELGRPEKAKERLLKLLDLANVDVDFEVHMYLGQLTEGTESLAHYRKGLETLHNLSSNDSSLAETLAVSGRTLESLQQAESNAYCAIAELYMTDLCDLPEARVECQKAFEAATQINPNNPQAWLAAANFFTVTANAEAAREAVQHCLDLWWSKLQKVLDEDHKSSDSKTVLDGTQQLRVTDGDVVGQENSAQTDTTEVSGLEKLDLEELTGIPTSGLISLSRMMIELEMYQQCSTILEAVLEEEEDNLEVYYLLTVVGRKLWMTEDPDLLRFYATTAKVIAGKLGDSDLVDEMTELLAELPKRNDTDSIASAEPGSSSSDECDEEKRNIST